MYLKGKRSYILQFTKKSNIQEEFRINNLRFQGNVGKRYAQNNTFRAKHSFKICTRCVVFRDPVNEV